MVLRLSAAGCLPVQLSNGQGQGEIELRSLSQNTSDSQRTAHHLDQAAGNSKPQPGSPVPDRSVFLRLLKSIENAVQGFAGNSDSRVLYGKCETLAAGTSFLRCNGKYHIPSLTCKLDSISDNINQHLFQPQAVRHKSQSLTASVFHNKPQALLLCLGPHHALQGSDEILHVHGLHIQLHLSALNAGHVQDIIDKADEILVGCL